ncbi:hypothetical protein [Streptomyces spiralis]
MASFDFPDDLLALERAAWEAAQQHALTPDQAAAVQAAVTEYAAETGLPRVEVEMGLKRAVRHPDD